MLQSLTYLFWILVILGSYLGFKYKNSRNKKLFFKGGAYKPLVWVMLVLTIAIILLNLIIPEEPVDVSFLELHSEEIADYNNPENDTFEYYLLKSFSVISEMHLIGFVAAMFVLAIWLYFIRSLDFYNTEKLSTTFMVLISSMLLTFLTFPLSDLVNQGLNIKFSDNTFYNLFVYSFLGIGVVEESIKALPVFIVLFLTSEVDEPFDLIYYACVSALGFAFVENLIYFRDLSGSIIVARALTSAIGHMIFASFSFYGVILLKWKYKEWNARSVMNLLLFGIAGAFIHGAYDYFLFEGLWLFFLASFIFFTQAWLIIINNAINNSQYFDYEVVFRHDKLKFNIAMLLVSLLIFSHLVNGLLYGISDANSQFFGSFILFGLLIFFYISNMSSLDLFQGYWRPVRIMFSSPSGESMPGARGLSTLSGVFKANTILPLNHIGKEIRLHAPPYNRTLDGIFPVNNGKIVDRVRLNYDDGRYDIDWFLVEMDQEIDVLDEYEKDKILLKIRNKSASLIHDEHIDCWGKIIPSGKDLTNDLQAKDFVNCGYVMINGDDYRYDHE